MATIERTISVHWRQQVHFTDRVFGSDNCVLRDVLTASGGAVTGRRAKVLVIVDEALAKAHGSLVDSIRDYFSAHSIHLELACPPVLVMGGEAVKNDLAQVTAVHALINRYRIDRHSYLVAVGGGALLDMTGLAAATAHRGVRLIRIPTTTLAQGDSGVGVKNGINAFGKKNFVGTFAPPFAVINDFSLLDTLSPRDKRAGFVEAIKVSCIRDRAFFDWIELNAEALAAFATEPTKHLIFRSAELHLDHIAFGGDPFEMGSARPLDFGHWAAHKIEQLSAYRISHGEAVAIGIALDVNVAQLSRLLPPVPAGRVLRLLERFGFDLFAEELVRVDAAGQLIITAGLEEFREHLGGELTITLLRDLGIGVEVHEMDSKLVVRAIELLRAAHLRRVGQEKFPN